MLSVSARYLTNMVAPVKSVRVRMVEDVPTSPIELIGSDTLMSCKVESVGAFLGTTTKKATVKLLGKYENLKDRTFIIYNGILDPTSGDYDEAELGYFEVDSVAVDYDKGFSTVVLYDAMFKAGNTPYNINPSLYPMTVGDLADAVTDSIGVDLASMAGLPNVSYNITQDLYSLINGFTLRDVIDEIAKATATTARISGNSLKFVPYTMTASRSLTNDNLNKYKASQRFGVINSIVLSRMPQNDNVVLTNDPSVASAGLTEVKIINNQILDNDRVTLITPIYDALANSGTMYMDGIEMTTEGHGIYEVGDTLAVAVTSDGVTTNTYSLLTDISLDIAGSLKEIVKCVPPSQTSTDYLSAGGIIKSIYNTEIKTDKQAQDITSIVSRQDTFEGQTADNFTSVHQDITNITNTFQSTGGDNLVQNSVGYARANNGDISSWTWNNTGTKNASTSPESQGKGALSGNQITLTAGAKLTQRVIVQANSPTHYSLSFMARKGTVGVAKVSIKNTTDNWYVQLNGGTVYDWTKFSITGVAPTVGYLDVIVEVDNTVVDFAITDIMLNIGDSNMKWTQANGEILNTQVQLNSDGIKVKSSVYSGDYTSITPLEFAGYSNASGSQVKVFSLNRDVTEVQKLNAVGQITMAPIKVVPITSGVRAGWSFVKAGGV